MADEKLSTCPTTQAEEQNIELVGLANVDASNMAIDESIDKHHR